MELFRLIMSIEIDDEAREGQNLPSVESYTIHFLHCRKGKSSEKREIITISCDGEDDSGDTEILLTVCCTYHHPLV